MQLEIRYREDRSDGSTQWRVVERVGLTPGSVTRHDGDSYGPFTTEAEARKFARGMMETSRKLDRAETRATA
jgi:hypothetical protein